MVPCLPSATNPEDPTMCSVYCRCKAVTFIGFNLRQFVLVSVLQEGRTMRGGAEVRGDDPVVLTSLVTAPSRYMLVKGVVPHARQSRYVSCV